jgi:hypothetical protein
MFGIGGFMDTLLLRLARLGQNESGHSMNNERTFPVRAIGEYVPH